MKLNYRDKVILGIIGAIVIALLGVFLMIKPKANEISDDKAALVSAQSERDEVQAKIDEIQPLKNEIEQIYKDVTDLTDDFVQYNDIYNSRKIDQYLQHFAEENEVKVMSLSAADIVTSPLDYYYFETEFVGEEMMAVADLNGDMAANMEAEKAEGEALSARNVEQVLATQYSVQLVGKRENIWNYLQALEDQDETIIINSVAISNYLFTDPPLGTVTEEEIEEGEGESQVQIVITAYSVYEMAKPNTDAD